MTIAGLGLRCPRDLEIELCEERRIAQLGCQRVLHERERWARAADEPFDRTKGGLAGALTERGRAAEAFEQDGRQREDIGARSHPVVPLFVLLWWGVAQGAPASICVRWMPMSVSLASPKSLTLTTSVPWSAAISRFDGLRSRWVMFCACTDATANDACRNSRRVR